MGISALNGLHRATADWGEGTSVSLAGIGAPATPGDATWLHTFFPDDTWLSPGGDFVATPSSVQLVGLELGSYTWGDTPQLRADIESWRADPSQNFGWVLIGDEVTEFSAKRFASRESLVPGALPVLRIDFDPCPADCGNDDGMVDIVDLLALLAEWGMPGSCDIDGSGVAITDLLALLAAWGECT